MRSWGEARLFFLLALLPVVSNAPVTSKGAWLLWGREAFLLTDVAISGLWLCEERKDETGKMTELGQRKGEASLRSPLQSHRPGLSF